MKIVRAFMRLKLGDDDADIDNWTLRMDSLLVADPAELIDFMVDASVALSVKIGCPIERILEIVSESAQVDGTDAVQEMVQKRWDGIIAALGEHMDTPEARRRLADTARKADWA